jgi:hypothetical protein
LHSRLFQVLVAKGDSFKFPLRREI